MSKSVLEPGDPSSLEYIITHVFCPLKLPHGDDHSIKNDRSLAGAIAAGAKQYGTHVDQVDQTHWDSVSRLLDNLRVVVQFQSLDRPQTLSQLERMRVGDVLAYLVRAQNAAVVFRKRGDATVFESFEVSPKTENVMTTQGKLVCSYPGPAIGIPNNVFHDQNFLLELVNFLAHMNDDILTDATPTTRKARSTILETRDTTHPRYITELLTGILRSVGRPADIVRISKRVGDDVVWNNSKLPWRRSSLWLLIRVVLQTTLNQSPLGGVTYKQFMLFFLCCLGKEKISTSLSNDRLQFMSAKISRRLRKLGASAPGWLSQMVLETCTSLRSTLEDRWMQVQAAQRVSPPWTPSGLDLIQDTRLSLLNSKDYLHDRLHNRPTNALDAQFSPEHRRRGGLDDFLSSDGTFFKDGYRSEPHVTLHDVERAVEEGIDGWVDDRAKDSEVACVQLELLLDEYSTSALKTYEGNPELLSIMLLTTIELWVALDKMAIRKIPILADYSPEVPTSLLESLLLRNGPSLDRLGLAHKYLSRRHSESRNGWSVFSQTATADTFAVRYYRSSSHLQRLKARIEESAHREVHKKIAELEKENAQHADLQRQADALEHTYYENWHGNTYHSKSCGKCQLEKELRRMTIAVHEWPLPAEQLHAETVVFELECPVSFNMWRSATFHLLVDLCLPTSEPDFPYITLHQYDALRPYLVQHPRSRLTLGSDTKPYTVSHYRTMSIPTTQQYVCVNNGLTYYGFDSHAHIPASSALGDVNVRDYCTYELPCGPYRKMQKYVDATSHTSNEVLANQTDCHKDASLHEYMAFGHLRSGGLLQWLNVLRELRSRSLTFRRPEVHLLIMQAISQVGPLMNSRWVWHQEICQPSFGMALIAELENLFGHVSANWLEGVTMDTISFLLSRLLASKPGQAISQRALQLLRAIRGRVFSWVTDLSSKLTGTSEDEEIRGLLRDAATICRSTFNVDPAMFREVLCSADDVKVLLSCAILIHDNTPSKVSSLSEHSQLLLERDRRLSLALETVLSGLIRTHHGNHGINLAVCNVWPPYRPGSEWSPLQPPNARWVSCTTEANESQRSQVVHYNLLNGSLLVDGKSLGRLPSQIMRHPLYNLIFGDQVLDVVPGDIPGMDYSTRSLISDHQVYFSLRNNESDLLIRAKRKQTIAGDLWMELIPQGILEGDLPSVLTEGYAHWLNMSTCVVEIRPLTSIWEESSENWRIDCAPGKYRMYKGPDHLVDIRSPSWAMMSELLKPLDAPQNLLCTVSPTDPDNPSLALEFSVVLPRYGLSFHVDEDGDLQFCNMRDMVYDENQCIGTFFGLVNRLVLRQKIRGVDVPGLATRSVLIPDGDISFHKAGHHVSVKINTQRPGLGRVTYQTYKVNTDLGWLETVSLTNRLRCAYLHALTSGCGNDPLTGRSGTEEALSLLWSGCCWSVMKLSPHEAELLGLIASMCPSRKWYPEHLRCMQKVDWSDLPEHSQHSDLYVVTRAIKAHYERLRPFNETQSHHRGMFKEFPSRENHLLERSAQRAAYLFPSDFSRRSSAGLPNLGDLQYQARDLIVAHANSGEYRAYTAAATVYHQTADATITKDILSMMELWEGSISGDATLSLQYDRSWLAPDLPLIWLKAYNLLRGSNEGKWFQLLFSLPAMAYASPALSDLVPVLVAFAHPLNFRSENPPPYDSYYISDKYQPSKPVLRQYVSDSAYSFEQSPESSESARYNESLRDLRQRQKRMYDSRVDSDSDAIADQMLGAWPCETPPGCSLSHDLYNVTFFTSKVQSYFSSRYHNLKLKEHLTRVQTILHNLPTCATPTLRYILDPSQSVPSYPPWLLTVNQLFSRHGSLLPTCDKLPRYATVSAGTTSFSSSTSSSLYQLLATAEASAINRFQYRYVRALCASADCLGNEMSRAANELPDIDTLAAYYVLCRKRCIEAIRGLQHHLGPKSLSEQATEKSGQWPCLTPQKLLQFLASNSPIKLSEDWKACLVKLALLMLELQRSRRLLRLHLDNHYEEVHKELQNEGYDGWDAEMHPDWLLVQLQSNFLVRRVQAEVGHEMISPCSGDSTAMQLNMGEGKSSVIVPVVVVVLANGDQLVRVIVPKALTAQMFRLLVDRLGRLTNRRIYFVPFSRSLEVDCQKAAALRDIMEECMRERGILLVQPEHILSLKLVSIEKQLPETEDTQVGPPLLDLQRWLHSRSRDILDESDEILHVRYQLVYTIGDQRHIEGFPERWTTTQQILSLVKKHASSLRELFPLEVEYECNPDQSGSFPYLRILHTGADAGQTLISYILKDIMDGHLPSFSIAHLRSELKDAIRNFISFEAAPPEKVQLVQAYSQGSTLLGGLLLLRGLLATGILLFALRERRWRVDYGLAPPRTMLAVPYRAKDVPAQRAEFGHPDVAIILTCLSYYYGGLDEEQLRASFEILLKQDDPSMDYDLWVWESSSVPKAFQTLNGINIKSSEQWRNHLFPLFSRNKATIDFYLSRVVFPKEAKEFPSKLSCSGWDLAEKRERLLTGFSGTNDGQYLLPLDITQRDPDHQRGTNAKVLSYLLQQENNFYMCMNPESGDRRTTQEFLRILLGQKPEIRVLLDVGAQMLDLENGQLAEAWLDINQDASAAIYFNEDDELTVLSRDGSTRLLELSPFAQQLDQCVIYLDDAHTRGTDIKFPNEFRAAVTLGPKVTKDRLAQGCMRMRKLGHGHSIMFFAPFEIDRRIRSLAGKVPEDNINTMDILHWAIRETCDDIQQRAPHWALQGTDHTSRFAAWSSFCQHQLTLGDLSDKWLRPEAKSLEDLYGPQISQNITKSVAPKIRQRCKELGILSLRDVSMDEEQEREVLHEAERERQAERPQRASPAPHSIHADVATFVKTGIVPTNSKAFSPAFNTLHTTSAATEEAHVWSPFVLTTTDFQRTIKSSSESKIDDYLRPVQWIVSGRMANKDALVVLSPHEANYLIPNIRSSSNVHLHLYTPRVTRSMKPCDCLTLYSTPSIPTGWTAPYPLMDQLNVFAGQLYLKDYETYIRLCRFLCVYTRDLEGELEGVDVGSNGFIPPKSRPRHLQSTDTFQFAPLLSLRTLMGLRRKGMCFALTHMGKVLDGKLLSEGDFDGFDSDIIIQDLAEEHGLQSDY